MFPLRDGSWDTISSMCLGEIIAPTILGDVDAHCSSGEQRHYEVHPVPGFDALNKKVCVGHLI